MLEHMPERMREALLTFPEVSAVKKFCVGDRLFLIQGNSLNSRSRGGCYPTGFHSFRDRELIGMTVPY